MKWYYAAEGKPVGPVDENEIRDLAREGKLTPDTLVWHEGMDAWKRFAELSGKLENEEEAPAIQLEPEPAEESVEEFVPVTFDPSRALNGETNFSIRDCFARGWDVVAARPWLCIGSVLLYSFVSLITSRFSLIGGLITFPLFAGLYWIILRISRGQETSWGDLLTPAKRNLVGLILVQMLPGLIFAAILMPFIYEKTLSWHGEKLTYPAYQFSPLGMGALLIVFYLGISWAFALPLVIDQSLKFWQAIQLSHRVVARHFFKTLVLAILCGLFTMLGLAIFYFGVLLTGAISLAALASAYDSLFSPANSGAQPPSNPSGEAARPDSRPE